MRTFAGVYLTLLLSACSAPTPTVPPSQATMVGAPVMTPVPVPSPVQAPQPAPVAPTPVVPAPVTPTPGPAPVPVLTAVSGTLTGNIGGLTSPTVRVLDQKGQPSVGTEVQWSVLSGSGWVYPAGRTDAQGEARASWILGPDASQTLQATVAGAAPVVMTAQATALATQANSVHLTSVTAPATGYRVSVQPLKDAAPTYFAAATVQDGYFGVQRTGTGSAGLLIFSVWDTAGAAQVITGGDADGCVTFGNEGTGQSCRKVIQWTVGETFSFELQAIPVGNNADMSVYVTRSSTGQRLFLGTIRHVGPVRLTSADAFVEDYGPASPDCLSTGERETRISPLQAQVGGIWQTVSTASLNTYYPRTRCGNILFGTQNGWYVFGTGGRLMSDPARTTLSLP